MGWVIGSIYISQSNKLREDIIKMHYDNILARHLEHYKTLEFLYNNKVQIFTGYSSFFINYSYYFFKGSNLYLEVWNKSA